MASSSQDDKPYTYTQAGVDIAAGNALVRAIAPLAKATARPGADASLGGFGGFFDLQQAGYKDPLLVGKTAEMPGMYAPGDYDLAGFCVGAVERGEALTGADVAAGHVVLGLA